jgi:hypothetical protein
MNCILLVCGCYVECKEIALRPLVKILLQVKVQKPKNKLPGGSAEIKHILPNETQSNRKGPQPNPWKRIFR